MRVSIIVTDDSGNSWQFELPLESVTAHSHANAKPAAKRTKVATKRKSGAVEVKGAWFDDLSLPLRPFIKKHARDASGPQKFTILVAHAVGGDLNAEVSRFDIEKQWGKMTGLLGGSFNAAFSTRAKDNGWVYSPKHGSYKLLPIWKGVLSNA